MPIQFRCHYNLLTIYFFGLDPVTKNYLPELKKNFRPTRDSGVNPGLKETMKQVKSLFKFLEAN